MYLAVRTSAVLLLLGAMPACRGGGDAAVGESEELAAIRQSIAAGRYEEADSRARAHLVEVERASGSRSVEAARVLDLIVECAWRSGGARDPAVLQLAERAVEIKRQGAGDPSLELATSLRNLAILHEEARDYAQARELYQRVLEIRTAELGAEHALVAETLRDLGNLALNTDRLGEARVHYESALRIQRQALGDNDAEVARTLNNLATLEIESGNLDAAQARYEEALRIKERQPDNDLDVAWTLNGLASVHSGLGDYELAATTYERALELRRRKLGAQHLHVAWILNNLADVRRRMGEYEEALSRYEEALEIKVQRLGVDDASTATTQSNLAELLHEMGDLERARQLYEETLALRQRQLGQDRSEVGLSMYRLASLLADMHEPSRARELCQRALSIWKDNVGATHPSYAMALDLLARLEAHAGALGRSEALLREALAIRRNALGPAHPQVSDSLYNLAELLVRTGDLRSASQLYGEALAIRESKLGTRHPGVATVLHGQAKLLARRREYEAALQAAARAEEIRVEHLRLTARTLPERQALEYATARPSGLDVALTVATLGADAAWVRRAWGALIRSRALVLDEMATRRRAIGKADDPEIASIDAELTRAGRQVANLVVRGPDEQHPERYRAWVDAAIAAKERAERSLAQKSLAFRREQMQRRIGLPDVVRLLPDDAALVAFALHERFDPGRADGRRAYIAFVASPQGALHAVALGSAERVEAVAGQWIREASRAVDDLPSAREAQAAYERAARALHAAVWSPLAPYLSGARTVFVVPDGVLNLVNLAALPVGPSYLIETGPVIHLLSAERDLVALSEAPHYGVGLLAMGGADYDDPRGLDTRSAATEPALRGTRASCGDLSRIRFEALPAAARESQHLVALWGSLAATRSPSSPRGEATYLTGHEATEAAFKAAAPGKRLLHLATHGFFLSGRCASTRGIGGMTLQPDPPVRVDGALENPLLLSGLALAGANQRRAADPAREDGILTAEEIATLDLSTVEWAVLSGCDTGIGEVVEGEGVFGMRRAFRIAGARTVIMSLWAVEDEAALDWMTALYRGRLTEARTTPEAVRMASLEVLRRRRQAGASTHPFFWAGFVSSGDWR